VVRLLIVFGVGSACQSKSRTGTEASDAEDMYAKLKCLGIGTNPGIGTKVLGDFSGSHFDFGRQSLGSRVSRSCQQHACVPSAGIPVCEVCDFTS
jgi:hypothetical protein